MQLRGQQEIGWSIIFFPSFPTKLIEWIHRSVSFSSVKSSNGICMQKGNI